MHAVGLAVVHISPWNNICHMQVADIRIYTRSKERVMPVINGAKLLQNTGKWQLILCEFVKHMNTKVPPSIMTAIQIYHSAYTLAIIIILKNAIKILKPNKSLRALLLCMDYWRVHRVKHMTVGRIL